MKYKSSLFQVGAIWKPKPGQRSQGTGSFSMGGQKQRFVVLVNKKKFPGDTKPDFVLMSSEPPTPDTYVPPPREDDGEEGPGWLT